MAIHEIDSEKEEKSRTDREEADKARQAREDATNEKLRAEELRAARAESALEEARRRPVESAPLGPTESQWQQLEAENPGRTRQEIQAEANKIAAITDARLRPLSDRAQAAEDRAKAAEERAARIEGRHSIDKVESRFYKDNAALEPHKKEVEAFLAEFPETQDAKTYEKRLGLAADYVRGKVKSLRSEPRRGEFSSRQVESDDRDDRRDGEFDGRVDARGLGGNRGALTLVENVAESFGRDTKHEDSVKVWKESQDDEGRGVQIDSREEVERARKIIARGSNIGGQRGDK
jgi:hypothetical protein